MGSLFWHSEAMYPTMEIAHGNSSINAALAINFKRETIPTLARIM